MFCRENHHQTQSRIPARWHKGITAELDPHRGADVLHSSKGRERETLSMKALVDFLSKVMAELDLFAKLNLWKKSSNQCYFKICVGLCPLNQKAGRGSPVSSPRREFPRPPLAERIPQFRRTFAAVPSARSPEQRLFVLFRSVSGRLFARGMAQGGRPASLEVVEDFPKWEHRSEPRTPQA